jgi:hypothetical protein
MTIGNKGNNKITELRTIFPIDVPPSSLNLVLLSQLFYLFCSSIVINTVIVTAGTFERNESGWFGALKSDSTHHNKGNNKITELRTIFQRESQNS